MVHSTAHQAFHVGTPLNSFTTGDYANENATVKTEMEYPKAFYDTVSLHLTASTHAALKVLRSVAYHSVVPTLSVVFII